MLDEKAKIFFEEREKEFVTKLPCLGISCDNCYLRNPGFGSISSQSNCVKIFKEDWQQYSRKKKLEKLLS